MEPSLILKSLVVAAAVLMPGCANAALLTSTRATITYHTVAVDGIHMFYREAGPKDAPTILLLHGFPSSSRMFETLIPLLADRYHLVAPDYPGFGNSDAPPPAEFSYTFDHIAETVGTLTDTLGLKNYVLFMQDYGGPVGFRLALAHPERVRALIVQNAVAHEEGLGPAWKARRLYWADRKTHEAEFRKSFMSFEASRQRHLGSSPNVERYDPDTWQSDDAFLKRPGEADIQADLFYDYRTNVASYPKWQEWLRKTQPPTLVVWGKYDPSFATAGATAYQRDVPKAEVHILDAGHFALDEACDEIAALTRAFLEKHHLDEPSRQSE
jgi:pimeloyl-ACP methyl ester carboxylesterase